MNNEVYLVPKDELYHYGVKGMKWGHRKKYPTSDIRKRYDSTKAAYKSANKEYSKAYNKAHDYSSTHPVSQFGRGHKRAEADRRWNDAIDKANAANKAQAAFKSAKKERNAAINDAYKQIKKDTTLGDKLLYNDASRKKAAKYMVDNNMSMSDAKKKANRDAVRNTAVILAAYGAYSVAKNH